MALIKCPECQYSFDDEQNSCPNCGCPTKEENTTKKTKKDKISLPKIKINKKPIIANVIILLLLSVIIIFITVLHNNQETTTKQSNFIEQPQHTTPSDTYNNYNNYTYNSSYNTTNILSLSKYEKIREGMTYEQVSNILGSKGNLVSSVDVAGKSIRGYGWYSGNGIPMICVVFQNGRVNCMYQIGLQ